MGKTLLLADDSVTIQKVVGISFASEDIAIKTVDNGDDAVTRARELRPDIILADVVMPGKSGYEVCEAVKGDPELRHIPVLLLTGTFEAFDEDRAARAGASGHIAKPFEAQTLVERVKQLLSQPAAVATVVPANPQAPEPVAVQPEPQRAAPAPPVATEADNAFDFFDDPVPDASDSRTDLEIDDTADAFAFDDDLGAPPRFAAGSSPAPPEPAAHTVAILPDDPPASVDFGDDELAPLSPESVGQALDASSPSQSEGFDFEFESMPSKPAPESDAGSEDFAESVLLDPAGDSAYDVSSSQLGDLSVEPEPAPAADAPAATRLFEPTPQADVPPLRPQSPTATGGSAPLAPPAAGSSAALTPPAPPAMSAQGSQVAPPPPLPSRLPDAELEDPVDSGLGEPSVAFVDEVPTAPPSARREEPETGTDTAMQAEDLWSEPDAARPEALALAEPEAPATSPKVADEALAQIAPALREQLHETLEKIAWEAFGQVTETMVAQAVERVEKIAWEVVPKLAETLIAEEIRRLKDEG